MLGLFTLIGLFVLLGIFSSQGGNEPPRVSGLFLLGIAMWN
jgi:hypothetical protein